MWDTKEHVIDILLGETDEQLIADFKFFVSLEDTGVFDNCCIMDILMTSFSLVRDEMCRRFLDSHSGGSDAGGGYEGQ